MKNPLLDKDFLLKLDEARERETYVRLIALTFDEHPVETIEGRTTQGNLNIDGKSAVRRTCSLTLVANEININDFYWGLNSKFKLEIGIKNKIDNTYEDIIWFPFGIYLITSFNTSQNVNSYNISISGKDKMCLLNGEIGGSITSLSVDFGTIEETDANGNRTIKKYPIKDIIREGVHEYGNEPFHNIIINDLDDYGLELKEYRGDVPMYLFRQIDADEFIQMTINDEIKIFVGEEEKTLKQLIQTEDYDPDNTPPGIENPIPFNFDLRNTFTGEDYTPTEVKLNDKSYYIAKLEYGDTPGYTLTDLVFAGDLILSVGDAFTDVLDKIVEMLGGFEYFYDVYGRFVFQRKKVYTSISWNNLKEEDGKVYGENAALTSALTYSFEDSKLVQTFSNNPDLSNLKNDFSVWGTRKSATGKELPVHMRYAIDRKPREYTTITVSQAEADEYNKFYGENKKAQESKKYSVEDGWDWREIIYQMALDFRRHNHLDGFEAKVAAANPDLYPTGKTGYEQYYIDMEGFWRQLYNPDYKAEYSTRTFTEDTSKERFIKGFIEIDKANDLEYDKYYCFYGDDNYLVKYIDSIEYDGIFYSDSEGKKPVIDGIDLKNYIVYWKKGEDYQRYIDHIEETDPEFKETKVFIQLSSQSYAPVLDYFKIINLPTEEKEKEWDKIYILLNNEYKEVSVFNKNEQDQYTQLKKLTDIISANKTNLFYKTINDSTYVAALNTYFYIKKERDIEGKILYTKLKNEKGNAYWTPYNNEIKTIDRQNNIYIKVGERKVLDDIKKSIWRQPIELLKVDRANLYISGDNGIVLFKDSNIVANDAENKTLYKINDSEDYYSVKKYEEPMRSLYIKNNKYQRYLYSPNFTAVGKPTDYFPNLIKTTIPYYEEYYDFDTKTYWNYAVQNAPETLNFWIDFLDNDGELSQYSVPVVGNRPKAINDSSVKAIYFRDVPNVLFTDNINTIVNKKDGYNYIQLQKGMQALFSNSSQGKCAQDVVEENLYAHAYCTESISATVIPVYYLEPNTRIFIRDDNSKINGEYILNRMSISLAYNGMMNISANKAIERILY